MVGLPGLEPGTRPVGAQETAERAPAIGQESGSHLLKLSLSACGPNLTFLLSQAPLRIRTHRNRGRARIAPAPVRTRCISCGSRDVWVFKASAFQNAGSDTLTGVVIISLGPA